MLQQLVRQTSVTQEGQIVHGVFAARQNHRIRVPPFPGMLHIPELHIGLLVQRVKIRKVGQTGQTQDSNVKLG
ncbi:hypothetical protein D3C75_1293510 [compost metagenome]